MNLIKKMTTSTKFSVAEREIIKYVLENGDNVLEMSINELAKETYTSNSAIIRLCKKLGVQGFRNFKIEYAQELEKYRNNKSYVDVNYPFHMLENPKEIANDIATLTISTIDVCLKEIDTRNLYQISKVIVDSEKILYYAMGDSKIRANSFENKLQKIGIYMIDTYAKSDSFPYAYYATDKDCALFVSYSSSNKEYIDYARILKTKGITVITITANPQSVLAKLSDYLIVFPDLEDPIDSIATFYSQIAIEYILNVLYSLIYNIHYVENQKRRTNVETKRINQKI
jgi:DNA-binding MurR/RpiR family transcriptional regulator